MASDRADLTMIMRRYADTLLRNVLGYGPIDCVELRTIWGEMRKYRNNTELDAEEDREGWNCLYERTWREMTRDWTESERYASRFFVYTDKQSGWVVISVGDWREVCSCPNWNWLVADEIASARTEEKVFEIIEKSKQRP